MRETHQNPGLVYLFLWNEINLQMLQAPVVQLFGFFLVQFRSILRCDHLPIGHNHFYELSLVPSCPAVKYDFLEKSHQINGA